MYFTARGATLNFVCHICGKSFKRKEHLKTHQTSVHEKVEVECNFCKKKMHPSSYNRHVKYVCAYAINQDQTEVEDDVVHLNEEFLN